MICYSRHEQVLALLYTLSFAEYVAESRNMKARVRLVLLIKETAFKVALR